MPTHHLHLGQSSAGEPFTLPPDAVTQTFACLARRGGGKTYTASVLAEEFLSAGYPIVVIDPIGVWWGLRADGRGKGMPVLIMGGEHKDIPLDPAAGEFVAEFVVSERISVILDVSEFTEGQMRRFVGQFLQAFYRKNREPVHLFLDEADEFAPQSGYGPEAAACLGAAQNVIRRGRARGIGATLITQRSAVLNKSVLTQTEALLAFQTTGPQDLAAIDEWIKYHGSKEEREQIMSDLTRLPRGTCWFYSPGWLKRLERVSIRQRTTFDSSKTPEPGKSPSRPKRVADVDLSRLSDRMRAAIDEVKANDPKELKRQIADLKRQLAARSSQVDPITLEAEAAKAIAKNEKAWKSYLQPLQKRLSSAAKTINEASTDLGGWLEVTFEGGPHLVINPRENPPAAMPAPQISRNPSKPQQFRPPPSPREAAGEIGNSGLRRMLVALAQRPNGLSDRQIGVRAGLSSRSGTFDTYLSRARKSGWIQGARDRMQITEAGLSALGDYQPLPTGRELLAHWISELGESGAARMLRSLAEAYPLALTREQLGEACGLSAGSGTFDTYLSRLRSLELVNGRGELRASEELFD